MSLSDDLLDRYLAGECLPGERIEVERYLAEHPDAAKAIGVYLARLDGESDRPPAPDTSASWLALRSKISRVRPPVRATRWAVPAAIAAGIALGAILSYRARATSEQVYTTARGERSTLRLADGTTIRLAPASRLRVSAAYGRPRREMVLDGEAYFSVAHDPAHPFVVLAGTDTVRDVGTAYDVRAYAADSGVDVIVREGRVALTGAGLLGAGDRAHLAPGVVRVEHGSDVDAALGWMDGRLTYRDAPLRDVLRDAGRWYVVDASVRDTTLWSVPFTGTLSGLSAHDALALVAATTGLTANWDGVRVTLSRAHAH